MSGVPYQSFVSSKPFLVVGPGERLFYVHGTLLSESSPVLRKDVLGGMRETQMQTIEIKDVEGDIDDDTVMRFIEYAYSGDYTVPEPDIVQLPDDPEELQDAFRSASPVPDENDWAHPTGKKSKKLKKKSKAAIPDDFDYPEEAPIFEDAKFDEECADSSLVRDVSRVKQTPTPAVYIVNSDRQNLWTNFCAKIGPPYRPIWEPRDNNDEREDYTPIFLCHARLYKFSDRYGCENLMDITLRKLRLTLSRYTLYSLRAPDMVELVRYTYTHTTDVGFRVDKLRALILDYVVCYFRELISSSSFRGLLQEGGSLSLELMVRLAEMVA